jgi:Intracellular septation protein A
MKLFFDFLPIILFFGVFKIADMNPESAARFATEHLGFVVSGGVVGVQKRRCCSRPSSSWSRP